MFSRVILVIFCACVALNCWGKDPFFDEIGTLIFIQTWSSLTGPYVFSNKRLSLARLESTAQVSVGLNFYEIFTALCALTARQEGIEDWSENQLISLRSV